VVLLLAGSFAAGVMGGVLRAWHVVNDTKALDLRVSRLEAGLITEIKRRAGEIRQSKPKLDLEDLKALATPHAAKQPWEL